MEVGRFCTEDRVSLERILCSAMEASVVETVLVAEKYAIWLLLEMGMLLKDMDALQKGANINEKVITTMVGRVKPEVEPENRDDGETDDDDDNNDDYDEDDDDDSDEEEDEDEDDGDDQDDDGGEDDLSGDEDSEGDDDDNDDPTANGEGGSEEEDDDDSDDDGEDEDDDEDEDEDEDDQETPQPPFKKMTGGKFYVVFEGRIPGIYDSWEDCSQHVLGYPRNIYKSYLTWEEAESAFKRYQLEKVQRSSGQEVALTIPIRSESSQAGSTSNNLEIKNANSLEQGGTSTEITKKHESDDNCSLVIRISDLSLD